MLAEPIQTVMRRYNVPSPYEKLKCGGGDGCARAGGFSRIAAPARVRRDLTRGHRVDREKMRAFVQGLEVPEAAKRELLNLSPSSYVGLAADLAKEV